MISIKNEKEIELITHAGYLVSLTHQYLKKFIKEGITTKQLDKLAHDFIIEHDAIPSCLGYESYPASICTSVNDEIVHGIPGDYSLKNGDIITIDMVIGYKGYQADAAWTYAVGQINEKKQQLLKYTEEALYEGLKQVKPGNRIGDISNAIENYAHDHQLSVVEELGGHGIGQEMHEDPWIPNFGKKHVGPRLKPGMVICIEPMLNYGKKDIYQMPDGWTIKTVDQQPSANFEHTVLVTDQGYKILTPRLDKNEN